MKTELDNFHVKMKNEVEKNFIYELQHITVNDPEVERKILVTPYFSDETINLAIDDSYLEWEELVEAEGTLPRKQALFDGGHYLIILNVAIRLFRQLIRDACSKPESMLSKMGDDWQRIVITCADILFEYIEARDSMLENIELGVRRNETFHSLVGAHA